MEMVEIKFDHSLPSLAEALGFKDRRGIDEVIRAMAERMRDAILDGEERVSVSQVCEELLTSTLIEKSKILLESQMDWWRLGLAMGIALENFRQGGLFTDTIKQKSKI